MASRAGSYGRAMEVACPKCKAEPGQACRSVSGRQLANPHMDRRAEVRNNVGAEPVANVITMPLGDKRLAKVMKAHADRLRKEAAVMVAKADALDMTAEVVKTDVIEETMVTA